MAENEQYTGRLGLESRDRGTLSAAVSVVVDTLEDFGHPADKIEARAENTARLQCDHYLVTVRLRRVPLCRSSRLPGSIMQPEALLEITLQPLFPDHCDQEITELLLAEVLRQLLPAVEATSVEWLETAITLSCEQFLSAFEAEQPASAPPSATDLLWEPAAALESAAALEPAAVATAVPVAGPVSAAFAPSPPDRAERPRGRACFTPVEQTAMALEAHCERAFQAAPLRRTSANTSDVVKRARSRVMRSSTAVSPVKFSGSQLLENVMSALSLSGARRMRFISNMLLISALLLFIDSADMVQAARSSLP